MTVVAITGASAGVGRATARAFAREGADVGLIARGRERLESAKREIRAQVGPGQADDAGTIHRELRAGDGDFEGRCIRRVVEQQPGNRHEAVVPALGLSKPPTEYPLSNHLYSLASHFVYGASTEATRRLARRLL